jgi:hypothetical protein
MVDGIDAGDCVEAAVGKGKLLVRVHNTKARTACEATLTRKGTRRRDGLFVDVNSDDRATAEGRDSESRTTRAASDIEESFSGNQAQPPQKCILLVCSEPAILSNVFAKSFSPNFAVQFCAEIRIVGVVLAAGHLDFTMLAYAILELKLKSHCASLPDRHRSSSAPGISHRR